MVRSDLNSTPCNAQRGLVATHGREMLLDYRRLEFIQAQRHSLTSILSRGCRERAEHERDKANVFRQECGR